MKAMENHVNKFMTFLLDGASGSTFLWGWFSGHDVLMLLGALASFAAILNHGSQMWERRQKNKK